MLIDLLSYDPKKNKRIKAGTFDEDTKVFTKECSAKHFFKIIGGYGIQEDVIQKLDELLCEEVIIKTKVGSYHSKFLAWLGPTMIPKDYGHGKQRFMAIAKMSFKPKEK